MLIQPIERRPAKSDKWLSLNAAQMLVVSARSISLFTVEHSLAPAGVDGIGQSNCADFIPSQP